MPSLTNDIRQLFAQSALIDFDRLQEAAVEFTFDPAAVYLSSFDEAMQHLMQTGFLEADPTLLRYAQVFERLIAHPIPTIEPSMAGTVAAALYWLAGYSANAHVLSRAVRVISTRAHLNSNIFVRLLSREQLLPPQPHDHPAYERLYHHITTGDVDSLAQASVLAAAARDESLARGDVDGYLLSYLLVYVLRRLRSTGFWPMIREYSSAPIEGWQKYIARGIATQAPLIDLWPSQRAAIRRGLLDGRTSLVVRTPTSSGKTKMTELAFLNDLLTHDQRRCLYIAPFRALVAEVENDMGRTLSGLGIPVVSLYGGSEANALEAWLYDHARVVIATPEKIDAVQRYSGGSLKDFGTVVLDEGHLLDSLTRGARFELQLTSLKTAVGEASRAIFISAVLPNSSDIASWLAGSPDNLAEDSWQPTTMRVGVVTWPDHQTARLTYKAQSGQEVTDGFFVPRVLQEEEWKEESPDTGRMHTYRFPARGDNATIAATLAFQASKRGPVIIFTSRPDWANSIASKILLRAQLKRPLYTGLVNSENTNALSDMASYLAATLGPDAIQTRAIPLGFAVHHGGIPQAIRLVIEDEFRRGNIRLLIATNTIAQGVNFPAKTIIVHSFPRTDAPVRDFWNLAGRAGRALRETEGEVIVLATGKLKPTTLSKFLDRGNAEPLESVILQVVHRLIRTYGLVSSETISALLAAYPDERAIVETISAIDAQLLDLITEETLPGDDDPAIDRLAQSLLATYQAHQADLQEGTSQADQVKALLYSRRSYVLNRVPDAIRRRKLARSALSLDTSLHFDDSASEVLAIGKRFSAPTADALRELFQIVCLAAEAKALDPSVTATLTRAWITTGSYSKVFDAIPGFFKDPDDAVTFVESTFNFLLPWLLHGLIHLCDLTGAEQQAEVGREASDWLRALPEFVRLGVETQELAWTMSLGITDRRYAQWILDHYKAETLADPATFFDIVRWIAIARDRILTASRDVWPPYFTRQFEAISVRYSRFASMAI